jgi:formylglycine-generating enzyme required for sulfatase activity
MRRIRAYLPSAAVWASCWLALLTAPVPGQAAAARLALVIGNSHYEGGTWEPLRNPGNDATAMAAVLAKLGFQVIGCGTAGACLDASHDSMEEAIRSFLRKLAASQGAIAFVYFSGHAVQARRAPDRTDENFLIPVRSGIQDEFELVPRAVSMQDLLDEMTQVGVQAGILVLDACRDNGLRRGARSSRTRGLAFSERQGFLIAYSAEPGHVALDSAPGSDPNLGPYARRLSEQLLLPKSITDVFLDTGTQVVADTRQQQRPQAVVQLAENLYLAAAPRPATTGLPAAAPAAAHPAPPARQTGMLRPARLADLAPGTVFRDCDDCLEMVRVPEGSFDMGSPDDEEGHGGNEIPVHKVSINYPLAVSRYPVTRGQWRTYLSTTDHGGAQHCARRDPVKGSWEESAELSWSNPGFPQEDTHPVVCVSWAEAQDYALWLSRRTGRSYRLLTESEYEFVQRAGSRTPYFWGYDAEEACRHANTADLAVKARFPGAPTISCNDGHAFTSAVGSFKPNAFGLHDISGNVWSWTADCYHGYYFGAPSTGNDTWNLASGGCSEHTARGGSWDFPSAALRSASRAGFNSTNFDVGFRLARGGD